jgi:large subunit ribosomal protein L25
MKQVPLAAKVRTIRGSSRSRRLRAEGFVPAEVYGHKEGNQSIEVVEKDLVKILSNAKGENIFFAINIEGAKGEPVLAVIKEVQFHKVNNSVLHADFHKVKMNEKIRIKIPIRVLNGDLCAGVKEGGVLQTFMRTLEVQCLPTQIPEAIQVDALELGIGSAIHVSDLKLPEGVKSVQLAANVVVSVAAQTAEEVKAEATAAAPVEGAAAAGPEVITAKKKEEGEADAKAPAGKTPVAPAAKADKK